MAAFIITIIISSVSSINLSIKHLVNEISKS